MTETYSIGVDLGGTNLRVAADLLSPAGDRWAFESPLI